MLLLLLPPLLRGLATATATEEGTSSGDGADRGGGDGEHAPPPFCLGCSAFTRASPPPSSGTKGRTGRRARAGRSWVKPCFNRGSKAAFRRALSTRRWKILLVLAAAGGVCVRRLRRASPASPRASPRRRTLLIEDGKLALERRVLLLGLDERRSVLSVDLLALSHQRGELTVS